MREQNRRLENQGVCPNYLTTYKNNIIACVAAYPVIMTEWGFSQSDNTDPGSLLHGTIADYGRPLMDFVEGLKIGNTAWVASHG
jgi:hypothetical protein